MCLLLTIMQTLNVLEQTIMIKALDFKRRGFEPLPLSTISQNILTGTGTEGPS